MAPLKHLDTANRHAPSDQGGKTGKQDTAKRVEYGTGAPRRFHSEEIDDDVTFDHLTIGHEEKYRHNKGVGDELDIAWKRTIEDLQGDNTVDRRQTSRHEHKPAGDRQPTGCDKEKLAHRIGGPAPRCGLFSQAASDLFCPPAQPSY